MASVSQRTRQTPATAAARARSGSGTSSSAAAATATTAATVTTRRVNWEAVLSAMGGGWYRRRASIHSGGRGGNMGRNMVTTMKVLVGYDGSDCSDAAIADLRHAGLPPRTDARVVTVANVWPQASPGAYELPTPAEAARLTT